MAGSSQAQFGTSLALDALNPEQRQAVTHTEGPLLVLAGAGSGKTRVITTRIAYLIRRKQVPPQAVVAMTFTNKAAREMSERVAGLVPRGKNKPFIGTFHSFGVSFLRRHIAKLDYRPDFTIYDQSDQLQVVREVLSELPEQAWYSAKTALWAVQNAKSEGISPDTLLQRQGCEEDVLLGTVYREYQRILKAMNAIDFEDILQLSLRICREFSVETQRDFSHYRHILVDEYQDTNRVQHELLRNLVRGSANLCVVGDDDQSIYGWRGAEPDHILNFEREYPTARTIRLELNYRSTNVILSAANQVIAQNTDRHSKTLRGCKGKGAPLEWIVGEDEADEVEKAVTHLRLWKMRSGGNYGDTAILYRSNFQARRVEEALRLEGIPYLLVGGTRFYDRREVKDAAAYLRLVHNPSDEVSLFRIINFPGRGIGRASQTRLLDSARALNRPCFELMREAEFHDEFPRPAARSMSYLAALLDRYRSRFARELLGPVFRELMQELDFHQAVEKEKSGAKAKETARGFVHEFEQATDFFSNKNPDATLKDYLERVALLSIPEATEDQASPQLVRLMTVHGAKGLEFPQVYLIGMAEEVFPHKRALEEGGEAEERRLAYVAITRARKKLVLSMAKNRNRHGEVIRQQPSRFVLDIDAALFQGVPPATDEDTAQPLAARQTADARGNFFAQLKKVGG